MENKKEIVFDRQPTDEEIKKIEFAPCERFPQEAPFDAKALYESFYEDQGLLEIYREKRLEVTGIATKVGPDMHNKPSVELSDEVGGQTYALCIFPKDDILTQVSVGDRVVVQANYLIMSTKIGVIFKMSELIKASK